MGQLFIHAVAGATLFAGALAWWERGEAPGSTPAARLAPWVLLRLVVLLWLAELAVVGTRAPLWTWIPVPVAVIVLAPWWWVRASLRTSGALSGFFGRAAALHFGGDPTRAAHYARAWSAFRRGSAPELARLASRAMRTSSDHCFDAAAALSLASQRALEGNTTQARHQRAAIRDFESDRLPQALAGWMTELDQLLDAELAAEQAAPQDPLRVRALEWLDASLASSGQASAPSPSWAERCKARGLDPATLFEAWQGELRELIADGPSSRPDADHSDHSDHADQAFAAALESMETRLQGPRSLAAPADMEWEAWANLRALALSSRGVHGALLLSHLEPVALALASRLWRRPEGKAIAVAVLTFLERRAHELVDPARVARARRNLVLALGR